jgi:hypothetical protein
VSESDPWFEQGASANLFAGRFRNFVVARCRGQGLNLSADELDMVDAWFAGGNVPPGTQVAPVRAGTAAPAQPPISLPTPSPALAAASAGGRWWTNEAAEAGSKEPAAATPAAGNGEPAQADEFPRFVRSRLRG